MPETGQDTGKHFPSPERQVEKASLASRIEQATTIAEANVVWKEYLATVPKGFAVMTIPDTTPESKLAEVKKFMLATLKNPETL